MKRNVLYLLALFCTLNFLIACDDDEKNSVLEVNASYSGETLDLKYSGSPLLGKAISFETEDGKTATITMKGSLDLGGLLTKATSSLAFAPGVVPGEVTTTLTNVLLTKVGEKYTFEGTDSNNGRELKYAGEVEKDKLTMSVNVVMPSNNLLGTWEPLPYIQSGSAAPTSEPLTIQWIAEKGISMGGITLSVETLMQLVSRGFIAPMLADALQSITYKEDGNIVASFRNESTGGNWVDSPLNLAMYYIKDNILYVELNISMIMAVVEANNATTKADTPSITANELIEILKNFLPLLSKGVPLNYTVDNGKAVIFATEDLLLPVFNLLTIPMFSEMIIGLIPEENQAMLTPLLEQLPEVLETTSEINISLYLETPILR